MLQYCPDLGYYLASSPGEGKDPGTHCVCALGLKKHVWVHIADDEVVGGALVVHDDQVYCLARTGHECKFRQWLAIRAVCAGLQYLLSM
jgi:hypothetical protein